MARYASENNRNKQQEPKIEDGFYLFIYLVIYCYYYFFLGGRGGFEGGRG